MKSLFQTAIDCEAAGEFGKAYELLTQCLSDKSHDSGEIAFHCGWCLENNNGDKQQAVRLYHQAFERTRDVVLKSNAAFRAGWILLLDKEYVKAADAFRTVIDLTGDPRLNHEFRNQALYWYALSLEHLGRYLEAIHLYETVSHLSVPLSPESIYRKIICRNQVGNFEAALRECASFPRQCPPGFDPDRHAELVQLIEKEERLLQRCLAEPVSSREEC